MARKRSPLNSHALTTGEVRSLGPGTQLTMFNMKLGVQQTVAYSRIEDGRIYGHPVNADGSVDISSETSMYLTDCGLEPRTGDTWNNVNITILASDLSKMPAPTGEGRHNAPWKMQ